MIAGDEAAGDGPHCRAIRLSEEEAKGLLKMAGAVDGVSPE